MLRGGYSEYNKMNQDEEELFHKVNYKLFRWFRL